MPRLRGEEPAPHSVYFIIFTLCYSVTAAKDHLRSHLHSHLQDHYVIDHVQSYTGDDG